MYTAHEWAQKNTRHDEEYATAKMKDTTALIERHNEIERRHQATRNFGGEGLIDDIEWVQVKKVLRERGYLFL